VRESENMVRDTTTRLERATGELEDLLVCATVHLVYHIMTLTNVVSGIREEERGTGA
jgi:hypothetical protein